MTNAGRLGTLHGLFDPLDRQMFSESPPVKRLKVICQEMKSVVEYCDES